VRGAVCTRKMVFLPMLSGLLIISCSSAVNSFIHSSNPRSHIQSTRTQALQFPKEGGFDPAAMAQIPLKIAVAGGGVGGMFLGYALQKKGFDVTVYEKASAFSRFGGPIQLASNALSCVNSLSPELFDEIMTRFTFTGTRKCGIKDGIRNTWYSVFDAITNLAEWNTLPYTGVIDRPDLQEILLDKVCLSVTFILTLTLILIHDLFNIYRIRIKV
jgi:hypothetical protein